MSLLGFCITGPLFHYWYPTPDVVEALTALLSPPSLSLSSSFIAVTNFLWLFQMFLCQCLQKFGIVVSTVW